MTPLSGYVLTAADMRAAELACGVPLSELMERAGTALAEAVWRFGGGRPTLILCGPGNNGGDGYVAARLLQARGLEVSVAASGATVADPARGARDRWTGPVARLHDVAAAPVLVDSLFGTGLTRPLDPDIAGQLHRLVSAARLVIAVDVPSGVGTDDGRSLGAAGAGITLAFAAAKPVHLLQPAAALCGRVLVADIGIAASSRAAVLARPDLPAPGPADHKYTRGMVVVVGGAMPGAAALAATAAMRSGAGYVVGVGVDSTTPHAIVRRGHTSLAETLADAHVGAVVIGPGLGRDTVARESLHLVMACSKPVILDGDGLWLLAEMGQPLERAAPTIATPHAGEFDRAFGDTGSKVERARSAAQRTGMTIVFKGADTVIASPDGQTTLAPPASSWLSSAGTGDVLAGIAGAMLARRLDVHDAACAAVWLHGEAARQAGPGLIADDLAVYLPVALAACR